MAISELCSRLALMLTYLHLSPVKWYGVLFIVVCCIVILEPRFL
jgi:hypothetical protein